VITRRESRDRADPIAAHLAHLSRLSIFATAQNHLPRVVRDFAPVTNVRL